MTGLARVGDIGVGICPHHKHPTPYTTVFVSGANTVFSDGIGACVVGTIGMATCGHPTIATSGSDNVMFEGLGAHRVGDTGANYGTYTVISGSDTVFAN